MFKLKHVGVRVKGLTSYMKIGGFGFSRVRLGLIGEVINYYGYHVLHRIVWGDCRQGSCNCGGEMVNKICC